MKTCNRCGVEKPRSEFYPHPSMADGLLSSCKVCVKQRIYEHRVANIDRVRAYDRRRSTRAERRAATGRVVLEWRRRHPQRRHAQNVLAGHVARGTITKPTTCQRCGLDAHIEAHHPDYTRPLDVEWLCKPCHVIADRERRAAQVVLESSPETTKHG